MIKLDAKDYYKVLVPLNELPFNNYFAVMVAENKATGDIFVDDADNPTIFYIKHKYGMSLLFGDWENTDEYEALKNCMLNTYKYRSSFEWMQAYPNQWEDVIADLLKDTMIAFEDLPSGVDPYEVDDKVIKSTRLNFNFNPIRYKQSFNNLNLDNYNIVKTTKEMFDAIDGSVVPKVFWDDAEQFEQFGLGFSLMVDGEIASTSFASYTAPGKLEIGIETIKKYRGLGYATLVSCKLIKYCMDNHLEPVWSCNLINTGSQELADKLGFDKSITLPYYKLIV